MKTTNLYKLLLLLAFLPSLPSLASDSLKVKKIEYYEDGKLVRAEYHDSLNEKITNYYLDYSNNFENYFINSVQIKTYVKNKLISFKSYDFKVDSNIVSFNNGEYIGNIQRAKYDSLGRIIENNAQLMFFQNNYSTHISSLDSLEYVPIKYVDGFKIRIKYDKFGNKIESRSIDKQNSGKNTFYYYDSSNVMIGWKSIDRPNKIVGKLRYFNNCTQKIEETYEGKRLKSIMIWKFCNNEKKQDFRTEKYIVSLKNQNPSENQN